MSKFAFGLRIYLIDRASCTLLACLLVLSVTSFPFHIMSSHFHIIGIILMHTSHSCIIVTETPEDAPVEPTEFVETEPGAECVVEQEENQGKQLSMIP
jgi:hypothetical protein